MFKKLILEILKKSGYFVQKKTHMSFGIDHANDIIRFSKGIQEVKVIFDVGANVGQTARYYAKNFPDAKIYSFEPINKTFQQLRKNLLHFANCKQYKVALGSSIQNIEIELQKNSVLNSLLKRDRSPTGEKEVVDVYTLDFFTKENDIADIDILKIDAEGYEIDIIKGSGEFLRTCEKCYIYIETTFLKEKKFQTQFSDVYEELYKYGFRFVGIYDHSYNSSNPARPPLSYCNALFHK